MDGVVQSKACVPSVCCMENWNFRPVMSIAFFSQVEILILVVVGPCSATVETRQPLDYSCFSPQTLEGG